MKPVLIGIRHPLVHEYVATYSRSARAILCDALSAPLWNGRFAAARRRVLFLVMTGMLLLSATAWISVPANPTRLPANRPARHTMGPLNPEATPLSEVSLVAMMKHVFRTEGHTYEDIAYELPSQTRSYVPRVLALVASHE